MNYEIVELKEKTIVGFTERTNNTAQDMQEKIGTVWQKLYKPENVEAITDRTNAYAIGLYSDYENGAMGDYDITAGFEVSRVPALEGTTVKVIPAGKYARFSVHGDKVKAVGAAWMEIWSTPLERTYTGDFEEYTSMEDIDIYIAIK